MKRAGRLERQTAMLNDELSPDIRVNGRRDARRRGTSRRA